MPSEEDDEFYKKDDDDYRGILSSRQADDFSDKYSKFVQSQTTGKGLKHDSLESSRSVLHALRGGGHIYQDLMHAYVHGKVPLKRVQAARPIVTNFAAQDNHQVGGSLPAVGHFHDGEKTSKTSLSARQIFVV